jgi:transcriptional regulator with XRE-family HTH domain
VIVAAMDKVEAAVRALAKRAKAYRNGLGLTQKLVAEKSGYSESHVGRVEAGKRGTSVDYLFALADALGVSIARLLTDERTRAAEGAGLWSPAVVKLADLAEGLSAGDLQMVTGIVARLRK